MPASFQTLSSAGHACSPHIAGYCDCTTVCVHRGGYFVSKLRLVLIRQILTGILPRIREGMHDLDDNLQRATLRALAAVIGGHPDVLGSTRVHGFSDSLRV